jgi:hypothetical protein
MIGKKKKNAEKKKQADEKRVKFTYYAPEAKEVYLAGVFNDWDICSLPMKRDKNGIWKTEIRLSPNRYEYKLFADGHWVEGCSCTVEVDSGYDLNILGSETVFNPLGTQNSVFRVD